MIRKSLLCEEVAELFTVLLRRIFRLTQGRMDLLSDLPGEQNTHQPSEIPLWQRWRKRVPIPINPARSSTSVVGSGVIDVVDATNGACPKI
jgi:hypothetical protein